MIGKVLINFSTSWQSKSDKAWLSWLESKLRQQEIETIFSFTQTPFDQTIESLQTQFDISESQTTVAHHNPGVLTLLRYVEKLVEYRVDKTLLVAGIPRGLKRLSTSKKSETTIVDTFQPGLILVWLPENIANHTFSGSIPLNTEEWLSGLKQQS